MRRSVTFLIVRQQHNQKTACVILKSRTRFLIFQHLLPVFICCQIVVKPQKWQLKNAESLDKSRFLMFQISPKASWWGAKFGSLHPVPCRSVRVQNPHNTRFVKFLSFVSCPLVPSFSLQKLQKSCRKLQCACYGISLAQKWQKFAALLRMLYLT